MDVTNLDQTMVTEALKAFESLQSIKAVDYQPRIPEGSGQANFDGVGSTE